MWALCLIISVVAVVISAIMAELVYSAKSKSGKKLKISYILIGGVFVAAFVMYFPVYSTVSAAGPLKAILLSALNGAKIFAGGAEFETLTNSMKYCPEGIAAIYQTWVAVLWVAAPLFTAGAVLSFVGSMSASFRYSLSRSKNVYVFSCLNDEALALAESVKGNNKKAVIVFTNTEKSDKSPLGKRLKALDPICFKTSIVSTPLYFKSEKRTISVFLLKEDRDQNVNDALDFISEYRNKEINVYVLTSSEVGKLALMAADKGNIMLRRIDKNRMLVNRILIDDYSVLFDNAIENDGNKLISAVVLGMGRYGTEMVKALSWFCQADGYDLRINAFDKDKLAADRFAFKCPELVDEEHNGKRIPGDAYYEINVHPDTDVFTKNFADKIKAIDKISYVFVALGNDNLNIEVAANMRMLCCRMGIKPNIQAVVYDNSRKKTVQNMANHKHQTYDIALVGDLRSTFTENAVINDELEVKIQAVTAKWMPDNMSAAETLRELKRQLNNEYNYNSTVASVLHGVVRSYCGVYTQGKAESDFTDEELRKIQDLEHRRWNAYMRSEGYIFSGSTDPKSRNDLAKMHNDIVPFEALSEEEIIKDSKVVLNQ